MHYRLVGLLASQSTNNSTGCSSSNDTTLVPPWLFQCNFSCNAQQISVKPRVEENEDDDDVKSTYVVVVDDDERNM